MVDLILASASPRRLQLLQQIGIIPCEILPANTEETPLKDELPAKYATRIASDKARVVAGQRPDAIVLAADTVVACGRRIVHKAEDEATARACLKLLSGRRHRVYTAVCIAKENAQKSVLVMTHVQFRRLLDSDIDHYIASNEWQGKAGGYAIQGLAQSFIPRINGSYSNVVGLPLAETAQLLKQAGLSW